MPTFEIKMYFLLKTKEDVIIEFVKATDHIKDHESFISKANEVFLQLHIKMDTLMFEVSNLQKQGDNTKAIVVVGAPLTKQDVLQHELDSQA